MTHVNVGRLTGQQAIRILRDENLIVSRQGSGAYVRERTERPVGLRPHLERAFEDDRISIDFAGFSGETLHGAVLEPLDQIRAGRLRPQSISVRLLVPDPDMPWSLPATVAEFEDSPLFRERARGRSDTPPRSSTRSRSSAVSAWPARSPRKYGYTRPCRCSSCI